MRILLAEDERALSRAIIKILEKNNCSADAVYNGEEALEYLATGHYDALILDIMMPKMDGITALKKLRSSGSDIPVMILSAKSEIDDKVTGLDSGANYYLTKPFDAKELLAALRTITRSKSAQASTVTVGNVALNRATYELTSACGSFRLANKEFQLLETFMTNPKTIIPVERLFEKIWGYDSETELNVVWVYVSYLRKKLSALDASVEIRASRNLGYSLEEKA